MIIKVVIPSLNKALLVFLLIVSSLSVYGDLGFIENKGQLRNTIGESVPFIHFLLKGNNQQLYITDHGLTYVFSKTITSPKELTSIQYASSFEKDLIEGVTIEWARIDMNLKGATIRKSNIYTGAPLNSYTNYYLSHCPEGVLNVQSYREVVIKNIYKDIDWAFNISENGFEYSFIVHPGADPSQIKMIYQGAGEVYVSELSQINLHTTLGNLEEGHLLCYQELDGFRKQINSSYEIITNQNYVINPNSNQLITDSHSLKEISIAVGDYDASLPLVIDPPIQWATYFGGSMSNGLSDMKTDNLGNLYLTSSTSSLDFPVKDIGGYFQDTLNGITTDIYISKFNSSHELLWSTYYGGQNSDGCRELAIDNDFNIYLTGVSYSGDFPVKDAGGYFQDINKGINYYDGEVIFLKFDKAGKRLWATYFGGIGSESGYGITIDNTGNIYAVGNTGGEYAEFPLKDGGGYYRDTHIIGDADIFVVKFNNDLSLAWSTFYGGSEGEYVINIESNNQNEIFIGGSYTRSEDLPTIDMGGYYKDSISSDNWDTYLFKMNDIGELLWSTYLGGNGEEYGNGIRLKNNGYLLMEGSSKSTDLPTMDAGGYYKDTLDGERDIFLAEFDNSGNQMWMTYYGGSMDESIRFDNISLDDCDNFYVGFTTYSDSLNTIAYPNLYYQDTLQFARGAFILHFDRGYNIDYATYFNHGDQEITCLTALGLNNDLYIGIQLFDSPDPPNYPLQQSSTESFFQDTASGPNIIYLAQFTSLFLEEGIDSSISESYCIDSTLILIGPDAGWYQWSNGSQAQTTLVNPPFDGIYTLFYKEDSCSVLNTIVYEVSAVIKNFTITDDTSICTPDTLVLTATGGEVYEWSTGTTTSSITEEIVGATNYSVIISDTNECTDTLMVSINLLPDSACSPVDSNIADTVDQQVFIPNVIILREGNINTTFRPLITGGYNSFTMKIYDRYGKLVYETTDLNQPWQPGVLIGNNYSNTVCQYVITVDEQFFTGNLTLLN